MRQLFGTEPQVRVMGEGGDPVQVHSLAQRLALVVRERIAA
ncbi:MAG: hypothetical protein WAM94_04290 [Chromatiaceae bacterium]